MKKLIFLLFLLVGYSCDHTNQPFEKEPETSLIFDGVQYYPKLGIHHNQELEKWFKQHKMLLKNTNVPERLQLVDNYFMKEYSINTSEIKYRIFNTGEPVSNSRTLEIKDDFNPFVYLENNKHKMSSETYNLLFEFFSRTEEITSIEGERTFLEEFENRVLASELISEFDKNGIRNIILVYEASTEYWSQNYDEWLASYSTNPAGRIAEKDYQKIAWADIVEGTAGGLIGGPLGALVGLAAGSITMAIGVSE